MALKCKSFKVEASQFLAEIIQMYLGSQKEFHEDIAAILRGVKPFIDRWNVRMDHESSEFQLMLPRIEDFKKSLHKVNHIQLIEHWLNFMVQKITESDTNSFLTGWTENHSPVKEGYLLKKYVPKIGSVSWTRRYFILENGRLSYNFVLTSGRRKGQVATTATLNVLLCNIRTYKSEERRFCFEIIHPKK